LRDGLHDAASSTIAIEAFQQQLMETPNELDASENLSRLMARGPRAGPGRNAPADAGGQTRLFTPSYNGLASARISQSGIDLESHIQDMLNVIQYEDLRDMVLIGHSYGGMVATGVADRARDRVAQLIYIDAFVPRDGSRLFDLNGIRAATSARRPQRMAMAGACRPMQTPPDTLPETSNGCPHAAVTCRSSALRPNSSWQNASRLCRAATSTPPASRRGYVWTVCERTRRAGWR